MKFTAFLISEKFLIELKTKTNREKETFLIQQKMKTSRVKNIILIEMDVNEQLWGDKAQPWPFSALAGAQDTLDAIRRLNSATPRLFAMIQ